MRKWGHSSVGRALPLQGRGRRFEPGWLHWNNTKPPNALLRWGVFACGSLHTSSDANSVEGRAPPRPAKVPVAESLTALLRTRQVLLAAPGTPGAERHGTEDKRKAHERSPGRVVIGGEHGESSA
jgi:hypothetical protein